MGMMKFFFLPILYFVAMVTSSFGQGKPFQIGVGVGFAPTWSFGEPSSSSNLGLFFIEPRYVRKENTFALRGEVALVRGASVALAFHHVFGQGKTIQPFIGVGCGYFYRSYPLDAYPYGFPTSDVKSIGFFPRVGLRLRKRVELIADYNLVPRSGSINPVVNENLNNNYLGVKLCVVINSGK